MNVPIQCFSKNRNVQDLNLALEKINQDMYILESDTTLFI